ncbi:MAG: ribosome-associated translation inhibitor RaiA [Clostridiales Family XIII bacterium]|jgi:putative sigma-54 modulation protein|nr:ribosome-associated translation inhibitor RaiA [Clostridiales Family XIII bacterium]
MKIIITVKNIKANDHLRNTIKTKLSKLDKYFSSDIETAVTLSMEKDRQKIEATINAAGAVFRAEETTQDIYTGIDRIADKLSSQMSKFKRKIAKRHKDNKSIRFEDIPDSLEAADTATFEIVRRKTYELMPMTPEEAILQMELLSHSFFIFLDMERDAASVVYRRNDGKYGLLETTR